MIGQRKHVLSDKIKALASSALAQKVGYLKAQDFPTSFFGNLSTQVFNAHRILRPKNELFAVQQGVVEIWHRHNDMLVTELDQGALFGDMPLLGQTMLGCQAIAGSEGVSVGVMDVELIREWIKTNPLEIFQELGPRFARVQGEHYKAEFQISDSRLAGLLLELAGDELRVEGFTHEELGEMIGVYRETVTTVLNTMKLGRLIEIGRKSIRILDRRALQELSEI
jgi:CRP-like cAMP-binding protein